MKAATSTAPWKTGEKIHQTLTGREIVIRPGENFVNTHEENETLTTWPQPQLHSGKLGRKFHQTLAGVECPGENFVNTHEENETFTTLAGGECPGENFINTYEENEMFTTWPQPHQLQRRRSEVDDTAETKLFTFHHVSEIKGEQHV